MLPQVYENLFRHESRIDPTSMSDAKVLVEMELDKDFQKLITINEKRGSIYLVNVDYIWIPSACENVGI